MTNVLIGRSRNRNENLDTGGNRSYKEKNENTTYRLKREVSKETALEFRPPASKTMKNSTFGLWELSHMRNFIIKTPRN